MVAIHHIALRVADCEVSARFYGAAFSLQEVRRTGKPDDVRAIWLSGDNVLLMLERELRGQGRVAGSGHVLIFTTNDLGESERRLAAAGIAITDRTTATLYVQDPDGHRAGVSVYRFELGNDVVASRG